mgnify:CR=1 FL=1
MVFIHNACLVILCIFLIYNCVHQDVWVLAVCSSHANYVSLYVRVLLLLYQFLMLDEGDAQNLDYDRQVTKRLSQPESIRI